MSTFASDARRAFYTQVWPRALINGKNHWCRLAELSGGTPVLVPLEHDDRPLPWPTLAAGEPGWIPTSTGIEAAFTAVLKTNAVPAGLGLGLAGDNDARRRLHLAEQHLDAEELRPWAADLLLQVAVFGQVVMS